MTSLVKDKNTSIYFMYIEPATIKTLQLTTRNTREKRRELAKKNKVPWNVYRALQLEIIRRYRQGLNLNTGKHFEHENS